MVGLIMSLRGAANTQGYYVHNLQETTQHMSIVPPSEDSRQGWIDFDEVWVSLGYSRKSKAKERLVAGFREGIDYLILEKSTEKKEGRPLEKIMISVDCFQSLKMFRVKTPKIRQLQEPVIRNKLRAKEGGQAEVRTEAGNIDLLTSSQVIEVKSVESWKSAVGQVLIYGTYYPDHQKRIHLFGNCKEEVKTMITDHCMRLGIFVTFETRKTKKTLDTIETAVKKKERAEIESVVKPITEEESKRIADLKRKARYLLDEF